MEKPSISQRGFLGAAIMGLAASWINPKSSAQKLHAQRGRAPAGKRWTFSSVYLPAGPHVNVKGTFVRNPKIAAQMNAMHDRWFAAKFQSKPASPI
jgi:hypothetical protein